MFQRTEKGRPRRFGRSCNGFQCGTIVLRCTKNHSICLFCTLSFSQHRDWTNGIDLGGGALLQTSIVGSEAVMLLSYLEVTDALITNVIGNLCPLCSRFSNELARSEQFIQQNYFKDKQLVLAISINRITDEAISVHFVLAGDSKAQGVTVNWKTDELPEVSLPIEAINLPSNVIQDFEAFMKEKIDFKKLEESLGVVESSTADGRMHIEASDDQKPTAQPAGFAPSVVQGKKTHPDMPDFDDEYEMQRPAGPPSQHAFPSIGHGDLDPPGIPKNPLLQPFVDPLQPQGDGGMYPTPNHPLFSGPGSSRRGVPPGARYDDPLGDHNLDMVGSGLPGGLRGPGFGGPPI